MKTYLCAYKCRRCGMIGYFKEKFSYEYMIQTSGVKTHPCEDKKTGFMDIIGYELCEEDTK